MTDYMNDASSEREAYSAPNYERLTFETSDLVQTSGSHFGFLGSQIDNSTAVPTTATVDGDW